MDDGGRCSRLGSVHRLGQLTVWHIDDLVNNRLQVIRSIAVSLLYIVITILVQKLG